MMCVGQNSIQHNNNPLGFDFSIKLIRWDFLKDKRLAGTGLLEGNQPAVSMHLTESSVPRFHACARARRGDRRSQHMQILHAWGRKVAWDSAAACWTARDLFGPDGLMVMESGDARPDLAAATASLAWHAHLSSLPRACLV